jgi:hypothetical protein
MNGLDLARTIRSRLPGLPMILTSGYSELLARDPGHGFTLLRKPYSLKQLASVMTEAGAARRPWWRALAGGHRSEPNQRSSEGSSPDVSPPASQAQATIPSGRTSTAPSPSVSRAGTSRR